MRIGWRQIHTFTKIYFVVEFFKFEARTIFITHCSQRDRIKTQGRESQDSAEMRGGALCT